MPPPVITYRGPGAWGSGYGSDLSALQFDTNNWNIYNSFVQLFNTALSKQIAYISEANGELFVNYTDHSIDGPFPIPTAAFNWRGLWQANTLYTVNDVLYNGTTLYLVIATGTSGATFALSVANYQAMLEFPAIPPINYSGTTLTLNTTYRSTYIRFTSATGCSVIIPPQSSVLWSLGDEVHLRDETGANGVTVTAASPAAINPVQARLNQTAFPGATLFLKNVGTDSWDIGGLQRLA